MTLQPQPASASVHLGVKRPANDISPVRSPSRIATPPPPDRQLLQARRSNRFFGRASASGVDPDSLSRALSRELIGDRRDSAPVSSPIGKRRRIDAERRMDADRLVHAVSSIVLIPPKESSIIPSRWFAPADIRRFIPSRSGQDLQASFSLLHDEGSPASPSRRRPTPHGELHFQRSRLSVILHVIIGADHC